jgi:hypothetical protein
MIAQLPLPGHGPNPSYPIVGYVLNDIETAIESVHVTLPMPTYNLWSYELLDDGAVGEVIVMPTIWPLDELTKTRVQPKPQFDRKMKKEKDE